MHYIFNVVSMFVSYFTQSYKQNICILHFMALKLQKQEYLHSLFHGVWLELFIICILEINKVSQKKNEINCVLYFKNNIVLFLLYVCKFAMYFVLSFSIQKILSTNCDFQVHVSCKTRNCCNVFFSHLFASQNNSDTSPWVWIKCNVNTLFENVC